MRTILYSIATIAALIGSDPSLAQADDSQQFQEITAFQDDMGSDLTPGWIARDGNRYTVVYGETVDMFREDNGDFLPVGSTGSSLSVADNRYRFECCGGTIITYDVNLPPGYAREDIIARATEVTLPNGPTLVFSYHIMSGELPPPDDGADSSTVTLFVTFETSALDPEDN